ncbi:MAG: ribosome silencing factor [Candidatus Omnitrophica bacterium]|nr:ribosome silencing factor [Candidatus Omnitrophota bacterium]
MAKEAEKSPKLYQLIARLSDDIKAEDIVVLDMRSITNFCDYFVICSGTSDRHVRAIAENIDEGLRELGVGIAAKQGLKKSDWIVYDAGDVVTHIFRKDIRDFYALEYLWQDAPRVDWVQ